MARADIERWDRKYAAGDVHSSAEPDAWLAEIAPRLGPARPRALAVDVACGAGANAIFLARRGFDVIGLDGSLTGLRRARAGARRAGTELGLAALDLDAWAPPAGRFALITVFRFLNRALYRRLAGALEPGGLIACRTFNLGRLAGVPGFNPHYLLAPGELAALFAGLEVLEIEDGEGDDDTSRLLARRPGGGS